LSELFCAVLCMTVVHSDTYTREQFLKMNVGLGLGLAFFIPPYGSMVGILFTVPLFDCMFVCMVADFSAAEKDSGMKFRLLVRLLSGMSFSHFGELWPRGGSPRSLNTRRGGYATGSTNSRR